ncbi:hypothetical protein KCU93_g1305, partial [Aureobasidium melanogenum]
MKTYNMARRRNKNNQQIKNKDEKVKEQETLDPEQVKNAGELPFTNFDKEDDELEVRGSTPRMTEPLRLASRLGMSPLKCLLSPLLFTL